MSEPITYMSDEYKGAAVGEAMGAMLAFQAYAKKQRAMSATLTPGEVKHHDELSRALVKALRDAVEPT